MLQMFYCSHQVLGVLPSICKFRWSDSSITGKDQFLHRSSMRLEGLHLSSKTCPEHWAGDQMAWFCFHFGVTAWLMLFFCRWTWLHSIRFGLYNRRTTRFSSLSRSMPVCTPYPSKGRREKVLGWQWMFHCAGWGQGVWHCHHEGKNCLSALVSLTVVVIRGRANILQCSDKEVLFPGRWGSSYFNIWWAVEINRGLERLHQLVIISKTRFRKFWW